MAFENTSLATPSIKWLGLRPTDVAGGGYSISAEDKVIFCFFVHVSLANSKNNV